MMNFDEIFRQVIKVLETELPGHLIYHNPDHTKYVLEKSILIARNESVNGHDLYLLKIAALYHDIGFIQGRDNHEETSCAIAKEDLVRFGFSSEDIDIICNMIIATKIPQKPATQLEKILADADLEYLGTADYDTISARLFKELQHFNPNLSNKEWYEIQVDFMTAHQFHTNFCKANREFKKSQNLENLNRKLRRLLLDEPK